MYYTLRPTLIEYGVQDFDTIALSIYVFFFKSVQ